MSGTYKERQIRVGDWSTQEDKQKAFVKDGTLQEDKQKASIRGRTPQEDEHDTSCGVRTPPEDHQEASCEDRTLKENKQKAKDNVSEGSSAGDDLESRPGDKGASVVKVDRGNDSSAKEMLTMEVKSGTVNLGCQLRKWIHD